VYSYNLIIKTGDLGIEHEVDAMVNQQLTRRFGPDVHYYTHAKTDNEVIVVVSDDSKRNLQNVLGDWFGEDTPHDPPYEIGALLHYREILRDEPSHILNKIGGSAND
jgi:hypothetical protein